MISVWSDALVVDVGLIAGGISAVTGFGIGSLLTPVLALQVDTRLAVAAVSIPHVIGGSRVPSQVCCGRTAPDVMRVLGLPRT
jgi:uncharacterized membrane protein YfcA